MKTKPGDLSKAGRRRPRLPFQQLLPKHVDLLAAFAHEAVARSLQYMARNYCRPIQLGDVVMVSGISRRGLFKAFNKHVGLNPGSLLRYARIESTKRLLIECDLPLKTIAERAGFRSENTLCVAFQRATGMSPKKFQRQAWLAACSKLRKSPSRLKVLKSNKSTLPVLPVGQNSNN